VVRVELPKSSIFVVTSLFLVVGCFEDPDSSPAVEARPGAAARPAIDEGDEGDEHDSTARDKDSPSDEVTKSPDESKTSLQLDRFHGVDELPSEHPCHDSTAVIWVNEHVEYVDGVAETRFAYERETLGELRKKLGTDWVHFGPRTVRGLRWETDAGEFVVASCNMGT
jgi:hypothetical protein